MRFPCGPKQMATSVVYVWCPLGPPTENVNPRSIPRHAKSRKPLFSRSRGCNCSVRPATTRACQPDVPNRSSPAFWQLALTSPTSSQAQNSRRRRSLPAARVRFILCPPTRSIMKRQNGFTMPAKISAPQVSCHRRNFRGVAKRKSKNFAGRLTAHS